MLDPKLLRSDLPGVAAAAGPARLCARCGAVCRAWRNSARLRRSRPTACAPSAMPMRRRSGKAKSQGHDAAPLDRPRRGRVRRNCRHSTNSSRRFRRNWRPRNWDCRTSSMPAFRHGRDETDNVEVRRWGAPRALDFEPKDHVAIGARARAWISRRRGASPGARFVVMTGPLAKLHRALIQFMLDLHVREHGYREAYVPYLVHAAALVGTGQLPKFEQDLFAVRGDPGFFLIPTAEVPVTNLVRDQILDAAALPMKYVAHTPCFRSEAGRRRQGHARHDSTAPVRESGAGADRAARGLLRGARGAHGSRRSGAQGARAALPRDGSVRGRRRLQSAKTYDLEVWLPSQQRYREISSCSNSRLSGAPPAGALAQSGHGQAGAAAHAQRLGRGGRAARWSPSWRITSRRTVASRAGRARPYMGVRCGSAELKKRRLDRFEAAHVPGYAV